MNLLLDCGNTRLKWALSHEQTSGAGAIERRGAVAYDEDGLGGWVTGLKDRPIDRIRFSSVIAPEQEALVLGTLAILGVAPERFAVTPRAGTLRNDYATQETLGVDRWAAAIGAWGLLKKSCVVVAAGTATTIDIVESLQEGQGVYRGGLILPGLDLMLRSLHQRAARLPQALGNYRAAPEVADNTHDAMVSGAIEATCGAIERMSQRLGGDAPWLLTGGNAQQLQAVLGKRAKVFDDLVLEGLALNL